MSEVKVTLLIPGYTVVGESAQKSPALRSDTGLKWLESQLQMPWQAHLCRYMGLQSENGDTLPVARFADHGVSAEQEIVCAGPIHLKADRDTASLIPPQQLGLTDDEADKLIVSVNDFLKEDGFEVYRSTASDWYMTGLDGQDLQSFPPSFLAHRNASAFLPSGENSGHWRRLMTELQMLLHTHPVNIERESVGKVPVNSLWFWGGAPLPDPLVVSASGFEASSVRVYSDNAYAHSLSEHMQVRHDSLSDFDALLSSGNSVQDSSHTQSTSEVVLVDTSVLDAWLRADGPAAIDAKNRIDSRWIQPMITKVSQGYCQQLDFLTDDGQHATCNNAVLQEHARRVRADRPSWWQRVLARFQ